jgi:predicted dithiol-disulfide oxidoreductase (DUF899 family)
MGDRFAGISFPRRWARNFGQPAAAPERQTPHTANKERPMNQHKVVTPTEWRQARKELLAKEKQLTRAGDELASARRALPWERVEKSYRFDGPAGEQTLGDLFAGRSQLVIYHFMFAPEWEAGCKSCSFWADNFNGIVPHLNQRDVTFVAISRAPMAKLRAFAQRLGWTFKWLSSGRTDFNLDYQVSFSEAERAAGPLTYNYAPSKLSRSDLPGISVFYRDASGAIFHTYSCYARGVETVNAAYHYLDLVPNGRDEAGLPNIHAWLKLHDQYDQPSDAQLASAR